MDSHSVIIFIIFIVFVLLILLLFSILFYGEHLRRSKEIIGGGLKMIFPSYFDDEL